MQTRLNIYLPDHLKREVERRSERRGVNQSAHVIFALEFYHKHLDNETKRKRELDAIADKARRTLKKVKAAGTKARRFQSVLR